MEPKICKINMNKVILLICAFLVLIVLTVVINTYESYSTKKNAYNNKNEYTSSNKVNIKEEYAVIVDDIKQPVIEEVQDINDQTILYFESVEEEIEASIENSEESISTQVKEKFVTLVDFIFYGTEINGVTFDELTEDTKQKLIDIVNRIDIKLEEKVPGYKETISSGAKKSYAYLVSKLKQGIMYLDEKAEEKIGTEKYEEIKGNIDNSVDKIKDGGSKAIDKGKELFDTTKQKIKNWYEGWK